MGKRPKTEWRVVCSRYGTSGHSSHAWPKGTEAKARQSVIDADHHAEMNPGTFYAKEAPYVVESREVAPWQAS
jgi:hypothetical protein